MTNQGRAAAPGHVVCAFSRRRYAAGQFVIGLLGCALGLFLAGAVLAAVSDGLASTVWFVQLAVYPLAFTAFSLMFAQGQPGYVRAGPDGLELAAPGRDPVLVPWSARPVAEVRWVWPFTTLRVTVPVELEAAVGRLARDGRRPRRRRAGGGVRYSVEAAGLRAIPAHLRDSVRAFRG